MAAELSAVYASSRVAGDAVVQSLDAAREFWKDSFEAQDSYHEAVWGEAPDLAVLLADAPHGDERAWFSDETSRFGVLARRVWEPLLASEQTGTS